MCILKQPRITLANYYDCTCVFYCATDPMIACSWSNVEWHVHPASQPGLGLCPVHPDAPGDL